MKKTTFSILNIASIVIFLLSGSLITFFAMNLFWSDIANFEVSFNFPLIISTFPLLTIALSFTAFAIFLVRFLRSEKEYRAHLVKHYSLLLGVFNLVGFITTILSASIVYKSFLAPCPFDGALIVYLIFHLIMTGLNAFIFVKTKKIVAENDLKKKITFKYVMYTLLVSLFTFIAFNRSGACLASPLYIEWSKLDCNWFFYIALLIPMMVLIILACIYLNKLNLKNAKSRIILWSCVSLVSIGLCVAVLIAGTTNPLFVSLISPAMPIERLATLPIDFIILFVPAIAISLTEFVKAIIGATKK